MGSNRRLQRGTVLVMTAVALVALLGFVGLVVDTGRMYVQKTEVQNAMDSCALAAARELTGADPNQLQRAESAGITVGNRNQVDFQKTAIALSASDITFSQTLNGSYQARSAIGSGDVLKMKYARCQWTKGGIGMYFLSVLNIGTQTVSASAVATQGGSQTSCAIPVALCKESLVGNPPPGTWFSATFDNHGDPSNDPISGSFRWVDFPDYQGGKGLKDALAGTGVCNLPATGTKVGKPGNNQGARQAWNTRFGIYQGGYDVDTAPPDSTGFAYTPKSWSSQANAYDNFVSTARAGNLTYQGDNATGLKTQGKVAKPADYKDKGVNRRVAIAPVVDCAEYDASHTPAVDSWACILMLDPMQNGNGVNSGVAHLEYLGKADAAGSPCSSTGLPGGPGSGGAKVPVLVQ